MLNSCEHDLSIQGFFSIFNTSFPLRIQYWMVVSWNSERFYSSIYLMWKMKTSMMLLRGAWRMIVNIDWDELAVLILEITMTFVVGWRILLLLGKWGVRSFFFFPFSLFQINLFILPSRPWVFYGIICYWK